MFVTLVKISFIQEGLLYNYKETQIGASNGMNSKEKIKSNDIVRYSRAGDAFHYRWAARYCLKMLNPFSPIKSIVIEGSKEQDLEGECIIDVAEYYLSEDGNDAINYYQLKHTTLYKNIPFNLSDLKDTVVGFAKRYKDHHSRNDNKIIDFHIVTNRNISDVFKDGVEKVKKNQECGKKFLKTFKEYTTLEDTELVDFCKHLKFSDGLGDFQNQWLDLQYDTRKLLAGNIGHPQIDSITALVAEKALPKSDGIICAEDILKRFGCITRRDLYPAPAVFERLKEPIIRSQYLEISSKIVKSKEPVIVHATGGIGKSVFVIVLENLLSKDSVTIMYDCFGLGNYRNRSQTRHRYRDGIVQIANELAGKGLCDPLIALSIALDDEILKMFLQRLNTSIQNIRSCNENGKLFIIIDAADNAEMVANEFGDTCFIHELLREDLPEYCHLIVLCRTERIELLEPSNSINKFELLPFNKDETFRYLKESFPNATEEDGLEFHRLTFGNPRVQANAIAFGNGILNRVLEELGPKGTTVEKQIEYQLDRAIEKIKYRLSKDYQKQIEAICCGLASLPPFIPISVLAVVAEVEETTVRSFISDLGRPIWVSDSVVQFRDEPTETWFRKKYFGTVNQVRDYIEKLKPLAIQFTYVAEVLPILYLQGEYYRELVELALSEDCLPIENPIDRRNVQMFRLHFAFKAALRLKQYYDASKLAMLAGEETAGNKRQLEIFKNNIDLIAPLQDIQKVQELAFKRAISAAWEGSQNVYSASLLSNILEYHGEARAYLRAAEHWLDLYFEDRKNEKKEKIHIDKLHEDEIVELIFAHYNLNGIKEAVRFMTGWSPESLVFEISSRFIKKLIDLGRFEHVDEISILSCNNEYAILGINNELLKVGRFVEKVSLDKCLSMIDIDNFKIPNLDNHFNDDKRLEALLSFAEACIARHLDSEKILKMLERFIPLRAPLTFDSDYKNKARIVYLRTVALRKHLGLSSDPKEEEWLPEKFTINKKKYSDEEDVKKIKEVFYGLMPWYNVRLCVLVGNYDILDSIINEAGIKTEGVLSTRYRKHDILPFEIAQVCVEIMLFSKQSSPEEIKSFYIDRIQSCDTILMDSRIQALRGANRVDDLNVIRNDVEDYVYKSIIRSQDDTETKANYFVELARATLTISKADAAEYFNMAITEVSRFGDELPSRWKAVSVIAKRCSEEYNEEAELSYRFIRCAELVGDNIAREKYWDRDEAIKICTSLSPASGLAAISRWRERDVGWFEDQFPIVANTIAKTNYIKPEATWALSAFIKNSDMLNLAINCISSAKAEKIRKDILEATIRYFKILDMPISLWNKLKEFLDQSMIENDEVLEMCKMLGKNQSEQLKQMHIQDKYNHHVITKDEKQSIFGGLDLMSDRDVEEVIIRFRNISDSYLNKQVFWKIFFSNVPQENIVEFMEKFIKLPSISFYELTDALPHIPEMWMNKPSFRRKWPLIIRTIAAMHSRELLNWYSKIAFFSAVKLSDDEMKIVAEGIVDGLAKQENIDTADEYFDFVTTIQEMITPSQARSLLEFSLSRFEISIDDDFGDGKWSEWLTPADTPEMNFAGFIWSALGSPESEARWNAVHAIKRLGKFGCNNEIKALLLWAEKNTVDCFGSNKFSFYNLNAHLYLLIAVDRISMEHPEIFLQYADVFSQYVKWNIPHALIHKKAINIMISIEKAFPDTYSKEEYDNILLMGKSQFPLNIVNYRDKIENNYENDDLEDDVKFSHGYDFGRYWFEPLGKIFGISEKTVAKLAGDVIIKEWKILYDGSYVHDQRHSLWDSHRYEHKTWHSHEQHPSVERYNFYLSYHAMFVVAARFFEKMPIIFRKDWDERNPWDEWIERHSLTRQDGFWLADCRGNVPLDEPRWMNDEKDKEWRANISKFEFLDNLVMKDGRICVKGYWENGQGQYREDISIASALVSKEASQGLLSALVSCKNSHDYKLPNYKEESMECDIDPFVLLGWIKADNTEDGLDRFDPWAGEISYPDYDLGDTYQELLGLEENSLKNKWYKCNRKEVKIVCENWSRLIGEYEKKEILRGKRMLATLDILKDLCKETGFNLVLEVQICRRVVRDRYSNTVVEDKYMPPAHKIYLLSGEGVLSDENGNIEFGKDAS